MMTSHSLKECIVLCPAKINLYLNTIGKREDGFHEIESVFQAVSLFDRLEVSKVHTLKAKNSVAKSQKPILTLRVHSSSTVAKKFIGADFTKSNLLHKVFNFFCEEYNISGLTVILHKHIPIGAGLGGGSSNVAGFIYAINKLFELGLRRKRLEAIGAMFGSDVPFFFTGGMAWVSGRGEKIVVNPYALNSPVLIAYPGIFLSTPDCYRRFNTINSERSMGFLQAKVKRVNKNRESWQKKKAQIAKIMGMNLFNSFQEKTLKNHQELAKTYIELQKISHFSMMSGSGSSFFCIFNDIITLARLCRRLKERGPADAVFALVDCVSYGVRLKS